MWAWQKEELIIIRRLTSETSHSLAVRCRHSQRHTYIYTEIYTEGTECNTTSVQTQWKFDLYALFRLARCGTCETLSVLWYFICYDIKVLAGFIQ